MESSIFTLLEKGRVGSGNGGRKTMTLGSNDLLAGRFGRVLHSASSSA